MRRRRFDHLLIELSVAVGAAVPRYPLWLALHERGFDPEHLRRGDLEEICDALLPAFLRARGLALDPQTARRLRSTLLRFDPRHPTPYERMAHLSSRPSS